MSVAAARPLVGVGVLIFRNGSVLVGQRKGSHGAGEWALPGGHLELGESFAACGAREVAEETGLVLQPTDEALPFAYATNTVFSASKHYVTVFVEAVVPSDSPEPQNLEPEKCGGWVWVAWPHGIPTPLFPPLQQLLESRYVPARTA